MIPGSGRSPGGGNGNSLQYSCLENPMDGGAWQATTHGLTKSQTRLKRLSMTDFTFFTFKISSSACEASPTFCKLIYSDHGLLSPSGFVSLPHACLNHPHPGDFAPAVPVGQSTLPPAVPQGWHRLTFWFTPELLLLSWVLPSPSCPASVSFSMQTLPRPSSCFISFIE